MKISLKKAEEKLRKFRNKKALMLFIPKTRELLWVAPTETGDNLLPEDRKEGYEDFIPLFGIPAMISSEELTKLRDEYPEGTRVKVLKMNDPHPIPINSLGTVTSVDDIGTIHVNWDCGSSLGIVFGEDKCEKVGEEEN